MATNQPHSKFLGTKLSLQIAFCVRPSFRLYRKTYIFNLVSFSFVNSNVVKDGCVAACIDTITLPGFVSNGKLDFPDNRDIGRMW